MTDDTKSVETHPTQSDTATAKKRPKRKKAKRQSLDDLKAEALSEIKVAASEANVDKAEEILVNVLAYAEYLEGEILRAKDIITEERELLLKAQSDYETIRVQMNHMELTVQDYEQEKAQEEEKKYEGIEEAGEW